MAEAGEIDPSFVITHTVPIDKGPEMYRTFRDKEDACIKVVLKPWAQDRAADARRPRRVGSRRGLESGDSARRPRGWRCRGGKRGRRTPGRGSSAIDFLAA